MIDEKDVLHIAKLSNLDLTVEEIKKFCQQLSKIFVFVQEYSSLQTEKENSLFFVSQQKNVFREDEIKPSLTQDGALANAKSSYKGFFKIKAIFD